MNKTKLKIITGILLLGLFCGVAWAAPNIETFSPTSNPTSTVGQTQEFKIDTNETCNITWYIGETIVKDSARNVSTDTYSNNTAPAGEYTVKAEAKNDNGTAESKVWTWKVESEGLSIQNFSPTSNPTSSVGQTQEFKIDTNQFCNITWYINETLVKDSANINTDSYSNNTAPAGVYTVKAEAKNANGTAEPKSWTWKVESKGLSIQNFSPTSNPTSSVGQTQEFKIDTNQFCNITWYINETLVKDSANVNTDTYSNNTAPAGVYTVKAEAKNANGTAEPKSWTWKVGTTSLPINVSPSEETINLAQGESKTFSVNTTNGQNINIQWYLNGELKKEEPGLSSSSYLLEGNNTGEFTLKLVATDPAGTYTPYEKTWKVNVQTTYHSSGNRIWDEKLGLAKTYTWNAQSYSGFYYDLDSGVSSEEMTIEDIDRNIDAGNVKYRTRPTETNFEYSNWGSYQVIGFMAEKYFAGYSKENSSVIGKDVSLISNGILSKILTDSDDKKSTYAGDSLVLEDGYSLNIVEVDVKGSSVWVQLEKDGNVVDDGFIFSGEDYVYKTELGGAEDVPVIIAHFGTVFSGHETSVASIEGIFQISDNYVELHNGDTFGKMKVKSMSSSEIRMENEDDIGLDKGKTIDLMGKIKLQVADNNNLRFAPVLDTSEPGTYELRGTVYDENKDGDSIPTWTPFNFEGFYYNIDEGIGTEELKVEELNGRNIPTNKLVYQSTPQNVQFEYGKWGNFTVVGFMADKYFAGYQEGGVNGEVDRASLLSNNILSKVLTDTDDKESMYSGSDLALEQGYSLQVKEVDINGNNVWVQLEKDGKVLDEAFVSSNQDYVYKTDIGKAENIPLIIVHFGTVFLGGETSAVFTQGIFQISDEYTEINNGDTFGKMKVSSVSESGIKMKNDDDIGLDKGDTVNIMGDVSFKTADDNVLRFYPAVEIQTAGGSRELKISVPDEIIVGETFDIGVTADKNPIEGASVKVNTTNVGKTDVDGIVQYTAENIGSLKLTAEKSGYTTANKNVNVIPPKEKMSVNVSPEPVYIGDTLNIEVFKAIGGDPIKGANVSIDGNLVNKTGSDGKVAYKTDKIGTFKLSVTKEGFLDQEVNVKVRDFEAIFKFSNLAVKPSEVKAGKDVTISVDVGNVGNAAGNKSVELLVNGNVTGSQEIPLDVGKNTTLTFKHTEKKPGNYTVEVGGETTTYIVKEKSSLLLYALGAIILLFVGGAAYYFMKGDGDVAELQEKIRELINK